MRVASVPRHIGGASHGRNCAPYKEAPGSRGGEPWAGRDEAPMAGLVDGTSEHLFTTTTLASQKDRNIPQGCLSRPADGQANCFTIANNIFETGHILGSQGGQVLESAVGTTE